MTADFYFYCDRQMVVQGLAAKVTYYVSKTLYVARVVSLYN